MPVASKTSFLVSPDSVDRDYGEKREQDERFAVREYWIVDEPKEKLTVLRLRAHGRSGEVRPRKGVLASEVLPGFYLRPEWCWQRPLPDELGLLEQMGNPEKSD